MASQAHQGKAKAPRHWLLWGNPPVTGGFHSQRASNAESISYAAFLCPLLYGSSHGWL